MMASDQQDLISGSMSSVELPSNNDELIDPAEIISDYYSHHDTASSIQAPQDLLHQSLVSIEFKIYKRRWWVLFMFSMLAFTQSEMFNSWSVISASVEAVFGWTDAQISLMVGWLYITYLIAIAPTVWLIDTKGLRISTVLCALLTTIAAVLRCSSNHAPAITWLAHAGHIVLGLSGPAIFSVGPVLSAFWFPPHQRATATAIATIAGYAGGAACFLIGPMLVEAPGQVNITPSGAGEFHPANIEHMRDEIMFIRYGECAVCVVILIAILIYFPAKPRKPPCLSATLQKLNFLSGIKHLFTKANFNFWLVGLPFGLVVSVFGVWDAMLDINVTPIGISEAEAGWLGFCAVTAGCVAALILGRVSDLLMKHTKAILVTLIAGCILSTFVILLFVERYVPMSTVGLFVACTLQGLFNNGGIPLYYELAIESTYPVPEVVSAGMMSIIYQIGPIMFLLLFLIPNIGTEWMNWCLYGSLLLAFPLIIKFRQQFKRINVDRRGSIQRLHSIGEGEGEVEEHAGDL